jgi:ABC-type molybdate transport system substrate-binding protein
MALADAAPAGKHGKAALEKLGVWDGVKDDCSGRNVERRCFC